MDMDQNKKQLHGFLAFDVEHLTELLGPETTKEITDSSCHWDYPLLIASSSKKARPGYQSMSADEYIEVEETLGSKIQFLAHLIRASHYFCVYSGAGISTAAGLDDYASKAEESIAIGGMPRVRSHFDTEPTLAHHILNALHNRGYLKHWVQQNHDGLPQKAHFPQQHLNEIHGAWYDPSNPVIPMSGNLRDDLFDKLLNTAQISDLCLVVGTSLAGMNADRVAENTARRCMNREAKQYGMIIVNLQQTQYDSMSSLRIFSKIDHALELLAKELLGNVPSEFTSYCLPDLGQEFMNGEDVYVVRDYDSEGNLITNSDGEGKKMLLDLREDAHVVITRGMYKGHKGEVTGRHREGHYRVRIYHPLKGTFMAPKIHTLGVWWLECAVKGSVEYLPIVNCGDSLKYF
eukprot:TRINITY_DN8817_c0_g1_i2.p1 TRINITY_DN8817_c0_g1~~TRINITY_DN8817_c0_g1_i2.p1  ORF type:complete len:426 (+),score=75.36 TRINITY_DN8817_c0_g1_i2:68-1279(+)